MFLLKWGIGAALVFGVSWIGAKLDLAFNGWLHDVEFKWTQFFTTRHAHTLLYMNDSHAWLILTAIEAAVFGFWFA